MSQAKERLDALFQAFGVSLCYLGCIAVCDLFQVFARRSEDHLDFLEEGVFDFLRRSQGLTLGNWRGLVDRCFKELAVSEEAFLPELARLWSSDAALLAHVQDILKERNEDAHPGGLIHLSSDEAQALCEKLRPRFEDLLLRLQALCDTPLGFLRYRTDDSYALHSCMGARIDDTHRAYVFDRCQELRVDQPFLVSPGTQRLLYLWPMLLERDAPSSTRPALYVFDRGRRNRKYLTGYRASAVNVRDSWELQPYQGKKPHPEPRRWLFEQLRSRPLLEELDGRLELSLWLQPSLKETGRLIGKQLGAFRLNGVIGAGGFGSVYAAEDGQRRAAVKVLDTARGRDQIQRFKQEHEALKKSGHPNIVVYFANGSCNVDGRSYLWYAMEYAEGGDLADRIRDRRDREDTELLWNVPRCQAQIIEEFRTVVGAVAELHSRELIHRDIKPGNVLVFRAGVLKISDFGLIKKLAPSPRSEAQSPDTSIGAVVGTRGYMAPEQVRGEEADKRSDVYALGILLAELATGRRPEPREVSQGSTLQCWPELKRLPKHLQKLVRKCTDVDRGKRPADAMALALRFETTAEPGNTGPGLGKNWSRDLSESRGLSRLAPGLGVLLILVACGAGYLFFTLLNTRAPVSVGEPAAEIPEKSKRADAAAALSNLKLKESLSLGEAGKAGAFSPATEPQGQDGGTFPRREVADLDRGRSKRDHRRADIDFRFYCLINRPGSIDKQLRELVSSSDQLYVIEKAFDERKKLDAGQTKLERGQTKDSVRQALVNIFSRCEQAIAWLRAKIESGATTDRKLAIILVREMEIKASAAVKEDVRIVLRGIIMAKDPASILLWSEAEKTYDKIAPGSQATTEKAH